VPWNLGFCDPVRNFHSLARPTSVHISDEDWNTISILLQETQGLVPSDPSFPRTSLMVPVLHSSIEVFTRFLSADVDPSSVSTSLICSLFPHTSKKSRRIQTEELPENGSKSFLLPEKVQISQRSVWISGLFHFISLRWNCLGGREGDLRSVHINFFNA
jgi:hypothetical protein